MSSIIMIRKRNLMPLFSNWQLCLYLCFIFLHNTLADLLIFIIHLLSLEYELYEDRNVGHSCIPSALKGSRHIMGTQCLLNS